MSLFDADWDVVVIGTGIGGGTAGRALAEAGRRVLFLEKGRAGWRAEETPLDPGIADPAARTVRGFWPETIEARIDGESRRFHAPLGSGVGGSSVFYAATLEAPEPHDLDAMPDRPHPTGGWPVTFAEFSAAIDRARALYAVGGEPDPLSRIPCPTLAAGAPPGPGDRAIMDRLRAKGLHPYRLHAAVRHLPDCADCFGRKCPRACKMDGRSAGVEPALATGRAAVAQGVEVRRLLCDGPRVTALEIASAEGLRRLPVRTVILAAGALSSPRLLLASASEAWPEGPGNGTGLVGRNLMFHLNELFALWPGRRFAQAGPSKAVGFRDLYFAGGQRLGMVQAMGVDVGHGEILHYLRERVGRSPLSRIPAWREVLRIPALLGARALGTAKVFVGLLEDLPYAGNRVLPGERIVVDYRLSDELLARRRLFRQLIRRRLRGMRMAFLSHEPEPNWGHPCGTLRMGRTAAEGVTAARGRVFGMENLWVADASVFPTSMGVNPSLTIAAHALRVAEEVA